jgi:hypothetical protein
VFCPFFQKVQSILLHINVKKALLLIVTASRSADAAEASHMIKSSSAVSQSNKTHDQFNFSIV